MSNVTVLVASMQKDVSLIQKMNITSKCIIANQIKEGNEEKQVFGENTIISLKEKGVGLNRNTALNRCETKYALLADDDEILVDNYSEIIEKAFHQYPNADVIVFNIEDDSNARYVITKDHRVGWLNFARYGAVRIAFKTQSIMLRNIHFHQMFGGGSRFSHGEDSIFLADCLRNRLKIYAVKATIAKLEDSPSTWFKGYNEKFFYDKGVLSYCMFKRFAYLFCLQDAIRNYKKYKSDITLMKRIRLAFKGVKDMKKGIVD